MNGGNECVSERLKQWLVMNILSLILGKNVKENRDFLTYNISSNGHSIHIIRIIMSVHLRCLLTPRSTILNPIDRIFFIANTPSAFFCHKFSLFRCADGIMLIIQAARNYHIKYRQRSRIRKSRSDSITHTHTQEHKHVYIGHGRTAVLQASFFRFFFIINTFAIENVQLFHCLFFFVR